ncbi:MAG: sensor histidine kinase [Nitriliruptorales bacterium]|nr:sensor histidine kinase [Nitriliruptorales bacterium]
MSVFSEDAGLFLTVFVLGFGGVGALIAARDPNPVGRFLLTVGVAMGLLMFAEAYGVYGVLAREVPGTTFAHWLASWLWMVALGCLGWLFYTFPDGRLPSKRWRWPARLATVAIVAMVVGSMFRPGPLDDTRSASALNPVNPIGIDGAEPLAPVADAGFSLFLLFGLGGGALSLVFRYRAASGEERYQLKWLAYAAGVAMGAMFLSNVAFSQLGESSALVGVFDAIGSAAFLVIPIAIAIAIFRYRLYDIDVVISKSLVYAGLAVFIALLYIGMVVGVGALVGTGNDSGFVLPVVATALVAVAFQPVRARLTRVANRLVYGDRATPYEVLSRFSAQLGEMVETNEALERMARLLAEGTGASRAQVWLRVDDELRPAVTWPPDQDAHEDPEGADHLADVVHEGETLGALSITKPRGESLTPQDERLTADLAGHAGLVLRNVRLTEELKQKIIDLRDSRQRLVSAQDSERRRLERDLHDGAQQEVVAIKMRLAAARTAAQREGARQTAELVDGAVDATDNAVETLRELAHGIYPPLLAAEGLAVALRSRADRSPLPVTVTTDGLGRYDQDVEAAVYFCVLEAVNNAAKYAEPDNVEVRLSEADGALSFEVIDDGAGFDPNTTTAGHGLTNMADRLDALGGTLEFDSSPGRGTTVRGVLPLGG